MWGVGGKDWGSNLQNGASHTYILRLGQGRNYILHKKIKINELKFKGLRLLSFWETNIHNGKTSFTEGHLFLKSSLQNDDLYFYFLLGASEGLHLKKDES